MSENSSVKLYEGDLLVPLGNAYLFDGKEFRDSVAGGQAFFDNDGVFMLAAGRYFFRKDGFEKERRERDGSSGPRGGRSRDIGLIRKAQRNFGNDLLNIISKYGNSRSNVNLKDFYFSINNDSFGILVKEDNKYSLSKVFFEDDKNLYINSFQTYDSYVDALLDLIDFRERRGDVPDAKEIIDKYPGMPRNQVSATA